MIIIQAWQWDTDIPIKIPWGSAVVPELDFMPDTGTGYTVTPELQDGTLTTQCPPQLLTSSRPIQIYARLGNTIDRIGMVCIKPRPKPPDYIDTPEQVRTWEQHETRLQAVENRTETDPTVPEWAKQPQKPTYTAAEVGAQPSDFVVKVNSNNIADKTYSEVWEAQEAGKRVILEDRAGQPHEYCYAGYDFLRFVFFNGDTARIADLPDWTQTVSFQSHRIINSTDKLPNPHPLTLTGAVSATYDGTQAVTVEIPGGGDGGGEHLTSVPVAETIIAKGTIPAGVTSAAIGEGLVDTGLTLGDLRKYKYWGYFLRTDTNVYTSLMIGAQHKVSYNASNGYGVVYHWADPDKTIAFSSTGGAGNNTRWGSHTHTSIVNYSIGTWGFPFLTTASDDTPIYIGITYMNGNSATTKDIYWSVQGYVRYEE